MTLTTTHTTQGPVLGGGIYTFSDVSNVMGVAYHKVHRWITQHWDEVLSDGFYTWTDHNSKAVGFHTLIELVVFAQLGEAGVSTKDILKSHHLLSARFNTPFPFALDTVLHSLRTDGKRIFFTEGEEDIYSLDGKYQFNLAFIHAFVQNIEFGGDALAQKFWPMGKDKAVVVDPRHQLGQPVVSGTNIQPAALHALYKAGETPEFIAYLYNLSEHQVQDALEFCKRAA